MNTFDQQTYVGVMFQKKTALRVTDCNIASSCGLDDTVYHVLFIIFITMQVTQAFAQKYQSQ